MIARNGNVKTQSSSFNLQALWKPHFNSFIIAISFDSNKIGELTAGRQQLNGNIFINCNHCAVP